MSGYTAIKRKKSLGWGCSSVVSACLIFVKGLGFMPSTKKGENPLILVKRAHAVFSSRLEITYFVRDQAVRCLCSEGKSRIDLYNMAPVFSCFGLGAQVWCPEEKLIISLRTNIFMLSCFCMIH